MEKGRKNWEMSGSCIMGGNRGLSQWMCISKLNKRMLSAIAYFLSVLTTESCFFPIKTIRFDIKQLRFEADVTGPRSTGPKQEIKLLFRVVLIESNLFYSFINFGRNFEMIRSCFYGAWRIFSDSFFFSFFLQNQELYSFVKLHSLNAKMLQSPQSSSPSRFQNQLVS